MTDYSRWSDAYLLEQLGHGPEAFTGNYYGAMMNEAERRGIAVNAEAGSRGGGVEVEEDTLPDGSGDVSPLTSEELLRRLEVYIGPSWEQHYRKPFQSLTDPETYGPATTWNWWAALFPLWFAYRGLYGTFALIILSHAILKGAALGLMVDLFARGAMIGILGLMGDRILYNRAVEKLTSAGAPTSLEEIAKLGEPGRVLLMGMSTLLAVAIALLIWVFLTSMRT